MRTASGQQPGTAAVCVACNQPFTRRKTFQQYCQKRCMTTLGPYGYVAQVAGRLTAMRAGGRERAVMPSGEARG